MRKKSKTLIRSRATVNVTSKQLIRMLRARAGQEPRCRAKHKQLAPHTCPYLEDVMCDKKTKCRCCAKCQELCAVEI